MTSEAGKKCWHLFVGAVLSYLLTFNAVSGFLPALEANSRNLSVLMPAEAFTPDLLAGEWGMCDAAIALPERLPSPLLAFGSWARSDCPITLRGLDITLLPNDVQAFWLGYALERNGQRSLALEAWQPYSAGIGNYFALLAGYNSIRSTARAAEKFNRLAMDLSETAVDGDPTDLHAWQSLGESAFRLHEWKTAEHAFAAKLSLKPDDLETLFWLGRSYRYAGKNEMATQQLMQVVRRANDGGTWAAAAWYELGYAYLSQNQKENAIHAFHRVQEVEPVFIYATDVVSQLSYLESIR
jgi:tetratricopeptide (TPR) repeat protein